MSERERWIIYPLLFFALGAAIRDKILHRLDVKEIYCESLKIVDQQDPLGRPLAELGIQRIPSGDPRQLGEQVGMLRLVTNEGQEVCQIAKIAKFELLLGKQLRIIDNKNRPFVVAAIGQIPVPPLVNGKPTLAPQGVLLLLNEKEGLQIPSPVRRRPAQQPATTL